jgi:hypothetical protein
MPVFRWSRLRAERSSGFSTRIEQLGERIMSGVAAAYRKHNYHGDGTPVLVSEKMGDDSVTLLQVGAWGQLGTIALAGAFRYLGVATALSVTCLGHFLVTVAGIVGIARNASAIGGPLMYPFIFRVSSRSITSQSDRQSQTNSTRSLSNRQFDSG